MPRKIFQIGFNKCGTRTIQRFLQSNGFATVHWDNGNLAKAIFRNLAGGASLIAGYEQFDVFTDMESVGKEFAFEAYKLFPMLADEFPEALFVLNTRDREDWIRSRLRHSDGLYARYWKSVLGIDDDERLAEIWREDWDRHHARVCDFFARRSTPFLRFDIAKDSPELIARFFPDRKFDLSKYQVRCKSIHRPAPASPGTTRRGARPEGSVKPPLTMIDL